MNSSRLISKITERGQITLPKQLRDARLFRDAHAVEFTEKQGLIIIHPVKVVTHGVNKHITLLNHAMRDWSDPENDDLFDFS